MNLVKICKTMFKSWPAELIPRNKEQKKEISTLLKIPNVS